ncbi:MAG: germination protein YpeB, partial [Bacillota bacterium]|nr:germination protein YpeB [Bacillota bacterium]
PKITGSEITRDEALERAKEFFPVDENEYDWALNGEGLSSEWGKDWSFAATPRSEEGYYWEVSVLAIGGHILSLAKMTNDFGSTIQTDPPPEPVISAEEAVANAMAFIEKQGINDMSPLYAPQYGSATFSDTEGAYRVELFQKVGNIYLDTPAVNIEVAGSTGELVRFENYLYSLQQEINIPEPVLTRAEARDTTEWLRTPLEGPVLYNPHNNKLFYTFIIQEGEAFYQTYINALTGKKEQVIHLYNRPWQVD